MAEREGESPAVSSVDEPEAGVQSVERESLVDSIKEEFHKHSSSSSSSESEEEDGRDKGESSVKDKIFRLFGRERPVHTVLGGGKPADILMWKNKKVSAGILGVATLMWLLFDVLGYYLVTLVCHCLIFSLAILFLWSNATTVINKSPPHIPNVQIPEDVAKDIAIVLRFEINRAFSVLRDIALGRDLKKFLVVIVGLWILSIIGNSCNFLTLFYIAFVLLFTVPALYEKYEDKIDPIAEKATQEIKKQYAVFNVKVLSKIPKGPLKAKKLH